MTGHFSRDRAIEWFEIPTDGARQLTLRFADPEVAFDGPWDLPLMLAPSP